MSRIGVVSDVHGNREALDAVLARLDALGVREIVSLGDLVGYCAEPNACAEIAKRRHFTAIAGNHELIALGRLDTSRCAPIAEHALHRTRAALSLPSRVYLATLPPVRELEGGVLLFHGTLDDPSEYLTTPARVLACAARVAEAYPNARLCLFGHTHVARVWDVVDGHAFERKAYGEIDYIDAPLCLANPGSVDASRVPGLKLARFAILDTDRRTLTFEAVPYDHERVEKLAREHGYRMGGPRLAFVRSREILVEARTVAVRGTRALVGRLSKRSQSPC
jgi:predicted phosphodiesterase